MRKSHPSRALGPIRCPHAEPRPPPGRAVPLARLAAALNNSLPSLWASAVFSFMVNVPVGREHGRERPRFGDFPKGTRDDEEKGLLFSGPQTPGDKGRDRVVGKRPLSAWYVPGTNQAGRRGHVRGRHSQVPALVEHRRSAMEREAGNKP